MVDMYKSVIIVLEHVVDEASSNSIRGEASGCLIVLKSFDFIFILHLMHKIMAITDLLCQALQEKSLDILNAMKCVKDTKDLLDSLKANGYDILLTYVQSFCESSGIEIPDMSDFYKSGTGRSCQQNDSITVEHHYHFDVFDETINFQKNELDSRFNYGAVELLKLSASLEPRDNFKSFNGDSIYTVTKKFYPNDFNAQELHYLRSQLLHYECYIIRHEMFQNMSTKSELCRRLYETGKAQYYHLIDKLIRLILTLPVSAATTKRSFSSMKLVKTPLRNKMDEEYLANFMVAYIEREFTSKIDTNSIIDEFYAMKHRRSQLI